MEEKFSIQAGDIFLVTGMNAMSKPITKGQKAFYGKAISSHILIAISDGIYIHATSDSGVAITTFQEEMPNIKDSWRAIRLKELSAENRESLMRSVVHFLGQDYNKAFFTASDGASFCSELAAKIYKQAGISILDDKESHKVIPADFDREADNQIQWEDITEDTKECFKKLNDEPSIKIAYLSYKRIMYIVQMRRKMEKVLEDAFLKTEIVSEGFKKDYINLKQNTANKVEVPYWDDTFKKDDKN